jgi:hypothetical protein
MKMEGINGDKIKIILNDLDEEFYRFNDYHRAKFAIDQIGRWQQKFKEVKKEIPEDIYGRCI